MLREWLTWGCNLKSFFYLPPEHHKLKCQQEEQCWIKSFARKLAGGGPENQSGRELKPKKERAMRGVTELMERSGAAVDWREFGRGGGGGGRAGVSTV